MRRALTLLALLATVPIRADVVVLRDGSERSGTVELCDEETCRVSSSRIPIAEIRAIHFGSTKLEGTRFATGAILLDGSSRKGRVTFVNRGVVEIDGEEIARNRVAAVVFTALVPPDVLILRSGTMRKGSITFCNAASCTLDGQVTPLGDVAWAGLAPDEAAPPATSGADEVHKKDGARIAARMTALNSETISTTRGPIAREDATWIHFAPPASPQPPQPGAFGAPQSPPAPPPPPPPTSSQPTPPPAPAPAPGTPAPPPGSPRPSSTRSGWPIPAPPAGAPPRIGGLWSGTVTTRYRQNQDGILTRWDIDARVRLRELTTPLVFGIGPNMRSIGSFSWLVPEGTVLTEKVSCQGEVSCSGEGTITVSGEENKNCAGFWWKNAAVDVSSQFQFDIPATGMYSVCLGAPQNAAFEITYRNPDGTTSSYAASYISPVIGRHPVLPRGHFMDPDVRSFAGGAARMSGTFFQPANSDYGSLSVSWSICREPLDCPPPGPPPPEPEDADDCPPPATQLALLERALAELRAKVEIAKRLEAEYKRIEHQARQWEGDYIDVMWDCAMFERAKTLTSFLLGNFAPSTPGRTLVVPTGPGTTRIDQLPGIDPGDGFTRLLDLIEQISDGDATWLVPSIEFGGEGEDLASTDSLWEIITTGFGVLEESGATPAQMREDMLSCGSPSIAAAKEGALQYLRLLEELKPLGERMNTVKNDIRNIETNQIEGDLWPKYLRECQRYEECREGGDPSRCTPPALGSPP